MNFIGLTIFGTLLLSYMQLTSANASWSLQITRLEYEIYRPDLATNVRSEMHKISRTETAPTIRFTLLRDMENVTISAGLYRINGPQKLKLPFNITGDLCTFIEKDFLIAKDFKKLGLTNCPIAAKEWVFEKIQLDANNLPNFKIIGNFMVKLVFFYEKKPSATAFAYITTRETGKPTSRKRNPIKFIDNPYRTYYF